MVSSVRGGSDLILSARVTQQLIFPAESVEAVIASTPSVSISASVSIGSIWKSGLISFAYVMVSTPFVHIIHDWLFRCNSNYLERKLMENRDKVKLYDWAMYVDASGDDGFAFNRGSSSTFTVNCFMCETSQIGYNKEILKNAKAVVRCPADVEMKSTTIIRSKRRSEICEVLSTLHGVLFQLVIFKKVIDPDSFTEDQRENHIFSSVAHSFTINMAASFHEHFHKSVCIIVDNMKSAEIVGTRKSVDEALQGVEHTLIFADSKSAEHSLLQVSDYFAGLSNRAFTDHEALIQKKPSMTRCAVCQEYHKMCHGKPWQMQSGLFFDIQRYVNLFAIFSDKNSDLVMGNGIRTFPFPRAKLYRFFDCVMHTYRIE